MGSSDTFFDYIIRDIMIRTLGHLFIAVSSIINLNQITATEHQSTEKHSLKTSEKYSSHANEEKSCITHDEDVMTKIKRLGPFEDTFSECETLHTKVQELHE